MNLRLRIKVYRLRKGMVTYMGSILKNLKFKREEIWSIPNMMGYFRILLIPVFCGLFLTAKEDKDYYLAAAVVLVSTVTDFLDGFVARKFHMVTELGKFVDPVADKLTHGALVICLAGRYPLLWAVVALMALKEGYMALMGVVKLKEGKKLNGAMWYGKVCTAFLFAVMFLLLFFPHITAAAADGLILLCLAVMLFTWVMYMRAFRRL